MDINSSLNSLGIAPSQSKTKPLSQEMPSRESVVDGERIQNEAGLVMTGPAFYRGSEEIRDRAAFSPESLAALSLRQQQEL